MTCDPASGEISVTEARQAAVHILNHAGVETFVTNPFAGLSSPMDAMADAQGRLVCLTRGSSSVMTITRLNIYGEPGSFSPEIPHQNWKPEHLIITRDGHYVTLETANGFMAKHDSRTGRIIWSGLLEEEDLEGAHLGRPCELPSGNILVPGGRLSHVLVLSPRGQYIESFGRFGSVIGRMIFPVGVAPGPQDTVLVLDRLRHKILVFDTDYVFLTEFGSIGAGPGQFYFPASMAANDNGSIFVAQSFKGRVQVFNVLGDRDN